MSLKIVVVGAGIAGLVVAASSLQQAGHRIPVLEKSSLSTVVGVGLHVNLNGGRVLAHLGFDAVRGHACRSHHWNVLCGDNFKQLSSMPLSATPGHPEP
ncbi:uncharacterized protein A1O5_06417 [Cladophialophora psammophila CBS 110553]|uniref:FAD-binding domain-containing protein n=1 Tax=Cladophialophora psammophila CBS 110553 TaxID=1182543 RepID=W9XJ26_9EURO|nr:uncharacterized protein A1O5_06417 [Cladophialophora psammophila CBS 110553]EXJ70349.1 hypothetical protein A1O5_06417 [Cladophialophora psammophila CBS 110553]